MSSNKRIFKKLYIALFVAMLTLPWIVWGGVRIFAPEYYAAQTDLSKEKRTKNELDLKELVKSGENLSLYIDDRVPFRGEMIDVYQSYEGKAEKVYQDVMRSLNVVFSGNGKGQKDANAIDSMFNPTHDESSDNVSDDEETPQGLNHEHSLTAIDVVSPTCEKEGYILYKCDSCDYTTKVFREPTGHNNVLAKHCDPSYDTYGYDLYVCKTCGKITTDKIVPKYVDTTYMAPQIVGENTLIGRFNWLFYAGNNVMDFYTHANIPDVVQVSDYGGLVIRLKELCDQRGITPVIMFMPNKATVYPEYLPTIETVSNESRTQKIADFINAYTGVSCLFPVTELQSAELYWQIYYKYDTHWNSMGAFVGLQTLYKTLGMELTNPLSLGSYEAPVGRNDLVTLGGLSEENYSGDVELIPVYRSDIMVEGLNTTVELCHTYSNSPNICKLVMLSDSYREMMAPYITKDFSECVIAHRKVTESCADDIRSCNILLITAVERDGDDVFKCIEKVISILEQQ